MKYNTENGLFQGIKNGLLTSWLGRILRRFFILMILMQKNLKFCVRHINYQYQIFFKEQFLKNITACQLIKDSNLEMIFHNYFQFWQPRLTAKKKLTNLLIMFNFIRSTLIIMNLRQKILLKKKDFNPSDLDSKNQGKRLEAREVLKKNFKDAVEISNTNLIRNSRALLATATVDNENFV